MQGDAEGEHVVFIFGEHYEAEARALAAFQRARRDAEPDASSELAVAAREIASFSTFWARAGPGAPGSRPPP